MPTKDFFAPDAPTPEALAEQQKVRANQAQLANVRQSPAIVAMLTDKYGMPPEQAQALAADLASAQAPVSGGLDANTIRQEAGAFAQDRLEQTAAEQVARMNENAARAQAFKSIHARLKAGEDVTPDEQSWYDAFVAPHRKQMKAAGENALATQQHNKAEAARAVVGNDLAGAASQIFGAQNPRAVPADQFAQGQLTGSLAAGVGQGVGSVADLASQIYGK